MELKCMQVRAQVLTHKGSNRTFMELKCLKLLLDLFKILSF